MQVSFVAARERLIARPVGRVDESSWEEFGAMLARGVEKAADDNREALVIDLSGIDYMSSRGLRVLTTTKANGVAAGINVRLAAPNDVMREILAISRYDRIFDVDDAVPDADRTAP